MSCWGNLMCCCRMQLLGVPRVQCSGQSDVGERMQVFVLMIKAESTNVASIALPPEATYCISV